jgi:hypothetical protein
VADPMTDLEATLDPRLRNFISVTEVKGGDHFADALFQRKYAHPAPDYPHHLATFFRHSDGHDELAHYLHFLPEKNISLIGGACTDGDVIRRMSAEQRNAIEQAGGLMLQATRYGLRKFGADKDAIFGHCGDSRSFEVLMQAGFQPVDHPHLLVYWPRLLDAARRHELIAQADALGAF